MGVVLPYYLSDPDGHWATCDGACSVCDPDWDKPTPAEEQQRAIAEEQEERRVSPVTRDARG